jgi:hypothetical protein
MDEIARVIEESMGRVRLIVAEAVERHGRS